MTSATSRNHHQGVALCLISATGFGLMGIFAKKAYAQDVSVLTLLVLRFVLAAVAFWAIVALRGTRTAVPPRGAILAGIALGAVGYAAQAGEYFGALTRIDASLTSLLLYVYPGLVFVGAVLLRRDHVDRRRILALALATGGAVLVLAGSGTGDFDALGVALALGSAITYACYILVADRVVPLIDPFLVSALIATGAAVTLTATGLVSGELDLGFAAGGWGWSAALAFFSTVIPIVAFLIGLPKIGPATASIVSSAEPLVGVGMAMIVFGERLGIIQIAGGALVLSAVVLLAVKVREHEPAAVATAAPPARAFAGEPA